MGSCGTQHSIVPAASQRRTFTASRIETTVRSEFSKSHRESYCGSFLYPIRLRTGRLNIQFLRWDLAWTTAFTPRVMVGFAFGTSPPGHNVSFMGKRMKQRWL